MKFPKLKEIKKEDFLFLFIVVLIPQIIRQVLYRVLNIKFSTVAFIASFETQAIISSNLFYLGILEEIGLTLLFVFLWFSFKRARFLTYGFVFDAFFDYISVAVWVIFGATPLQMLGLAIQARFILRELLFSYVLAGPFLYKLEVNLKKLSYFVITFGVVVLLLIRFLI
jgi:hypothetical protein